MLNRIPGFGKRFAHLARNAFARVIACDPYIIDGDFPAYVERVTLPQLFETADIISLHVPLNEETRGMVNGALLSSVQPGTILVNTARGAVVDTQTRSAATAKVVWVRFTATRRLTP